MTLFYVALITLISILSLCLVFRKLKIIDKPDGVRKTHKGNIPLAGGSSILLALVIVYYSILGFEVGSFTNIIPLSYAWYCSLIIFCLGFVDDINPLPTSIRLIFQILASWLVIILTDVYVRDLGDLLGVGNIYLGELGIPLTIFMVVGVCNAFNMMDGMDGLVGLVALSLSASLTFIFLIETGEGLMLIPTVILSVFLFFNLGLAGKKWKIFLGDSGATWLGFISAWTLIIFSQGEDRLYPPVAALWLILLPLIDALSTFISRIKNKKSLFSGDRTHIHHLLLDSGFKKWKVLIIFLFTSAISSVVALSSIYFVIEEHYMFYGFLTLLIFYFLILKYPATKS